MAKAGVTLAAGASMAPQSAEAVNAAAAKKRGARPPPVLGALDTQLHSRALTASETAYMQVAGLWAVGATATLAAMAAYFVLGGFLYVGGLPAEVALSPAAYAVFGLATLFNPLYAAILPILLPVTPAAAAATLAAVTSPLFVVFAAVSVPLAMILFGVNLSALSIAFKWAVAGRVMPGVHKHHSVRGVQLWTASRMVELTFKRFMMMCSGTWAMNYYLRALGAEIGDWSTFRLGMCLPLLPDSLELGSGVHVGDMANLVYSSAIDSESTVTAPVKLEDHALIGAAAVAMPGTTLGKGSTLGAMASSLPGAQLPGEMLYMGSPAQPVFKSAGSEKPAGPKQEKAKLMFQTWPFVQPAIAFGITAASTYITAVSALAAVALYGGALQSSTPLLLTVASALWAMYGSLLGCLGAAAKWLFTGRLEPHAGFPMYDSLSFRRALVLISEIPLGPFAEAVRASPIYNMFARLRGMTVGKGAFLDSVRLLDYELASFGEYAVVSRNALVYCHLASHKKGKLVVYQKRSTFGANCILGARSITLPGYTLADNASLAPVSLGAPAMSF